MIAGIDHVEIAAPPGCEEEARRFFGGVLGLEEVPAPAGLADAGGARFRCGAQELHVGVEPDFVPARKAHPSFTVDGAERLDAVAARLGAGGTSVTWDDRIAGVTRFYAEDPWGNRLEFRAV
jgi:catechol 2,3-dioxygenase-like lactoylglutathione lyase family enzyme